MTDATTEKVAALTDAIDAAGDRILIMGAGNTVMGDEGIGPRCVENLERWYEFPESVSLVDVGTMGLMILDYLREYDRIIVIDAAQETGHEPGTVLLFTPEELAANQVLHSAHDMRLTDVLRAAALSGIEVKSIVVVAVQVQSIQQWVLELSEPVENAIPIACAAAIQQLDRLGVAPPLREGSQPPALFFEALEHFGPLPEGHVEGGNEELSSGGQG